ncbi:MAG: winged helix-turn-helix transcriptional regulator [Anaerolineae bacterium]|nr:winged helix-turn-helix transcriptional regulator [Anaerolineae bacterium]
MATRGSRNRSAQIREFIIENVSTHPADITSRVAEVFGISRQAAHRHVKRLVADGVLVSQGEARNTRYELKPIAEAAFTFDLTPELKV